MRTRGAAKMSHPQLSREEIAKRGDEIYTSRLRGELEGRYDGQVVIINVETGEYEVDADSMSANKRALAKHPGALLYSLRVGSPVVENFSGPGQDKQ